MKQISQAIAQRQNLVDGIDQQKSLGLRSHDYAYDYCGKELKRLLNGQGFMFTSHYRDVFMNLVKYFNKDNSGPYSLNKGVLLMGAVGTGKTTLMRVFRNYRMMFFNDISKSRLHFELVVCADVVEAVTNNKVPVSSYSNPKEYTSKCFDEIGKEIVVNDFGTKRDIIENLLCMRYSRGLITHGTTNLNIAGINERYGERLYSRFHEMFNLIELNGIDFRIKE